jgi:hypothetical protein
MTVRDDEFERLLQAERDACERSDRLHSPSAGMLDESVRQAVHQQCRTVTGNDFSNCSARYRQATRDGFLFS